MESGQVTDFKGKEDKWFGYITGVEGDDIKVSDIDYSKANVLGIGIPVSGGVIDGTQTQFKVNIKN